MNKAITISTEGVLASVEFDNDSAYSVMSAGVGGYIEAVRLAPNLTMWCNESGLIEDLPINFSASVAYLLAFGTIRTPICGNVIFTGGDDEEGYTRGLDAEGEQWVTDLLTHATNYERATS